MSIVTKAFIVIFATFCGVIALASGFGEGFGPGSASVLIFSVIAYVVVFTKKRTWPCAWCGRRKLKFERQAIGPHFWVYRNKDGSPDMRVRGNHKVAGYNTFWRCRECGALTNFWHNPDRSPSREREVIQTLLAEPGKGERTGKEYVDTNSVFLKKESRVGS